MTDRVYLHVGPFKTGTTYVQGLLAANARRLAEQGVLYPRGSFGRQSRSLRDALGQESMPGRSRAIAGEWEILADELAAWSGESAVLSHEMLSAARPSSVTQLYRRLAAYDVHVIYTARDLSKVAPAMWQTGLRSQRPDTWAEYVADLRSPTRGGPGRKFWLSQDAPDVLERWRRHLPLESLHVVTVPPPGSPRELLWQRFCSVLGVDTTGHSLQPRRSNPSLGTAEAELVRRVNVLLHAADIAPRRWLRWSRWLGHELEQRSDMAKFALPAQELGWVSVRAREIVEGLARAGYPVVGDLDELLPPATPDPGRHPSDAADAEVLDAAVDAVHRAVLKLVAIDAGGDTGEDTAED
jgi:hypothetical protein